jgi:hypothetical protein
MESAAVTEAHVLHRTARHSPTPFQPNGAARLGVLRVQKTYTHASQPPHHQYAHFLPVPHLVQHKVTTSRTQLHDTKPPSSPTERTTWYPAAQQGGGRASDRFPTAIRARGRGLITISSPRPLHVARNTTCRGHGLPSDGIQCRTPLAVTLATRQASVREEAWAATARSGLAAVSPQQKA